MVKISKGDFVEIDFTARITNTGVVFDTTSEDAAKKNDIYSKNITYKPLIARVGEGQFVRGLDEFLEGKDVGSYNLELSAEKAFGKKDAKLLRLVSIKEFHKNNIQPVPGLDVELDGYRGIIRIINGGRVIVDFNHPLSSQDVTYDITVKGIVTDPKMKLEATLTSLQLPFEKVELDDAGKATVLFKTKVPDEVAKPIISELEKLSGIKNIEFK